MRRSGVRVTQAAPPPFAAQAAPQAFFTTKHTKHTKRSRLAKASARSQNPWCAWCAWCAWWLNRAPERRGVSGSPARAGLYLFPALVVQLALAHAAGDDLHPQVPHLAAFEADVGHRQAAVAPQLADVAQRQLQR